MSHGSQRVGRRHVAVIVAVDADRHLERTAGRFDPDRNPLGQAAAVGVAQHDNLRARLLGRLNGLQGELGIEPMAVEEMFGIVDHAAPLGPQEGDRVADHGEVFFLAHREHVADVEIPTLADERHHLCAGVAEGQHADVFFRGRRFAARHAESHHLRVLKRQVGHALEILGIFLVGKRIAAFDEIEPQLVELGRDQQLVLQRKVNPLALTAVAKRRVVDLNS